MRSERGRCFYWERLALVFVGMLAAARAGQSAIVITRTTDANTLANALIGAGGTGLTVTATAVDARSLGTGEMSAGTFVMSGPFPDTYGLSRPGVVLSTGDVADYITGPNNFTDNTTSYNVPATVAQESLLDPITGGTFDHFDVTQLDITFDVDAATNTVFFETTFGSEEYPEYVGSTFIDGFGLYLNGVNVAFVGGQPVNINHPDMAAVVGTELDGVLNPGGSPIVLFSVPVTPGSTGNILTFIVADTSDDQLDTTVFIGSLGGTPPPVLSISKSAPASVASGASLTYTISYNNSGSTAATSVVISETVPAGTTFVSATNGGVFAAGVVTWNIGNVDPGVAGQVSFTVMVTAPGGSTVVNGTYCIEGEGIPSVCGSPVTTDVTGTQVVAIPALGPLGFGLLVLLMAGTGLILVGRRRA